MTSDNPRLCAIRHYINGEHLGNEIIVGQDRALEKAKEYRDQYPNHTFEVFAYSHPTMSWTFESDDQPSGSSDQNT